MAEWEVNDTLLWNLDRPCSQSSFDPHLLNTIMGIVLILSDMTPALRSMTPGPSSLLAFS